ncbi:MAG: hypothetical protein H6652_20900 [Ardenticatenaceae bacterium]|nr:hypothetical protein [Ardenticatenaceae bacterium]
MKRKKIATLVILALFVALIIWLAVVFTIPTSDFAVGSTFAEALIYNEIDSAKRYSSPEIWSALESWPNKHNAISQDCKAPSDLDLGIWSISGGYTENEITRSYVIGRECPDEFYTVTIDDMTLRKVDNRWRVISLVSYCESTVNSAEICLGFD